MNKSYTVVNRYYSGKIDERDQLIPTFVKIQCMHCQDPACASACIVGALTKKENGAVHYDASKCIGCRYCMVACPFEIPAYEYHNPITPRVMKCTFCYERVAERRQAARLRPNLSGGGHYLCQTRRPCWTFGHHRIQGTTPGRYVDHIYGEKEVGGTSWMYLSDRPFEELGFIQVPEKPLPQLAETIQHSLFSYLWSPIVLFSMLSGVMWGFRDKGDRRANDEGEKP
jgi:formate dehydrogenase iron-sulfur subunit